MTTECLTLKNQNLVQESLESPKKDKQGVDDDNQKHWN
jgi:hypothetical protein